MHRRPRTSAPRRPQLVAACGAIALILVAGCGSDAADGTGSPSDDTSAEVRTDDVVTLQLDVATTDDAQMEQVAQVVRRRLDALGVERSDVGWDGATLEVIVPDGDQELLRRALAPAGQLELRPVLAVLGERVSDEERPAVEARVAQLRGELGLPADVSAEQVAADEQARELAGRGASGEESSGGERATRALNRWGVDVYVPAFAELHRLEARLAASGAGSAAEGEEITLQGEDGTGYRLGPVLLDGTAVESSAPELQPNSQWIVSLVLADGPEGIERFNQVAAECYAAAPTCPDLGAGRGQLAIVVDGVVLSAPTIQQPSFERDQIQVSGSFDEQGASVLAAALNAGVTPAHWTLRD